MNERQHTSPLLPVLRSALEKALDWRLLTIFTATVLWTTLAATFPAWRVLASVLNDSPRAKEIASSFDLLAFEDIGVAFSTSAAPVAGGVAVATLFGALSWPFLAAMTIGIDRRTRARSFAEVIEAGILYYVRMLRIGLVSIVPLALVGAVGTAVFKGARQFGRHAILESQATLVSRLAFAATLLVFIVIHASLEAGRAAFGADERLRSGWRAWLSGVRLTARHPLQVLGTYLGATLVSYVVAVPLLIARLRISGPGTFALVIGFLLTQLAVASLGWGRATRLFALSALARAHAPAKAIATDSSEAVLDEPRAVPSESMFRELGPSKSAARRG